MRHFTLILVLLFACTKRPSTAENPPNSPGSTDPATDPSNPGGGEMPGGDPNDPNNPNDPSDPDDPEVPVVRRELPLSTPNVNGYMLEDAYPGSPIVMPMAVHWPASKPNNPIVLERWGRIVRIDGTQLRVLVDFQTQVQMVGEAGAVGMVIHPQFENGKPYVYVWYNSAWNTQRLSRFTYNATTDRLENELLMIDQAETRLVHNAGRMHFGPDGFLYFGNGDDLNTENHQTLTRALFAGIFRIDVDMDGTKSHPPPRQPVGGMTQGYFIPNDNPFVGVANANEEFYALGLRNPFGFGFDRQTGDLYVADVGEAWREEINLVEKGGNYGWPWREGELTLEDNPITIGTEKAPLLYFTHGTQGDLTSVVGGYVYRGSNVPELEGVYLFSDWPSSRVYYNDNGTRRSLIDASYYNDAMGMAQDNSGEVYILAMHQIMRITKAPAHDVPTKLSETPVFTSTRRFEVDPSFVPYEINSPLWSDAAAKKRFIRVPEPITVNPDGSFTFPVGTMFVKQFDLPPKRIETRMLVVGEDDIYGVTYRWNDAGTDGDLVLQMQDDAETGWHYPNFGQCWSCHRAENRVLGFTAPQLDQAQRDALVTAGVLPTADIGPSLAKPSDTSASLEDRALAYLAAQCSGCHHAGASYLGGDETWRAEPGVPLAERGLINAPHHNGPMAREFGLPFSPIIDPGNPRNSLLLARIETVDERLQMPPLGRHTVDQDGVDLIEAWILSL